MVHVGEEYAKLQAEGLAVMIVLSEDGNYDPPTPEFCHAYAEQTGVDPALMLMDNGFNTLFQFISPGAQDFALPWEGVLNGVEMTYEWNSLTPGSGQGVVSGLLK